MQHSIYNINIDALYKKLYNGIRGTHQELK